MYSDKCCCERIVSLSARNAADAARGEGLGVELREARGGEEGDDLVRRARRWRQPQRDRDRS